MLAIGQKKKYGRGFMSKDIKKDPNIHIMEPLKKPVFEINYVQDLELKNEKTEIEKRDETLALLT